MPASDPTPLRVHVDVGALARQALTGAPPETPTPVARRTPAEHHGADDVRLAARQRAERTRDRRARSAGGGRSYAFRRS